MTRKTWIDRGFWFPVSERADGSLPLPAEPPIVTLAAMGGRSRERKAVDCFSLPLLVVSPELLLVPPAGGAATDNRPTPPEYPGPGMTTRPDGWGFGSNGTQNSVKEGTQ